MTATTQNSNLYWQFSPEWWAWFLMEPDSPMTARRVEGPFSESEAAAEGKKRGIPFPAIRAAMEGVR